MTQSWWADPEQITQEAAQRVLAVLSPVYRYPMPGSFFEALIEAMFKADAHNLQQLSLAFPGEATAVWAWGNHHDGPALLQRKAETLAPMSAEPQ
jgi:hypothetical protein